MEKIKRSQEPDPKMKWMYRTGSFANLLRMGHCAPTVMKTILDVSDSEKDWLVKLSAGMPGGIGNTGFECGAMTSPLVLLGLRYGLREMDRGLPVVFDRGHALCQHFLKCHKTFLCREIRGNDRFPKHCIPPVCLSPELFMASVTNGSQSAIPAAVRKSYAHLYSHLRKEDFHCAQAVLGRLDYGPSEHQQLFESVSTFMGGTLFMGMTCSAFAAGVMAVGLRSGEIENNPLKVVRMLVRMTFGGDAFDEKINKFNWPMNAGYRMSKWFKQKFGSTQCQAITQCDFSTEDGVRKYVESNCVTSCREIAAKVAEKVQETLGNVGAIRGALPDRAENRYEAS